VQFLPEDLGAFTREHDAVKIDLEEHLSSEVVRAVHEGAADLGICHMPEGANELQSLLYRHDTLVLIAPAGHPVTERRGIDFADSLAFDHVGLHTNSSIYVAMHQAALRAGRSIKLRIHVTGLDAMCRMIENGLGIGVMPLRAFELMQGGIGRGLRSIALHDAWAAREIRLVARDFSTLPVAARMLVKHLQAPDSAADPLAA
jgi:DNA-binding transcriptional LysR family regulator